MFMDELSCIKEGLDNVAQALREEVFDELTRMKFDSTNHRKAYRFLSAKQSRIRGKKGLPNGDDVRRGYLGAFWCNAYE
ncbi:DNA polymerase [Bienertia sinuspersici]